MKFLIDESLQQRLVGLLVEAGHDTVHVADLGLFGTSDAQVMAAAVRSGRVLVTADTDFGNLLALSGDLMPSVILMRRPGRRAEERCAAILRTLGAAGQSLENGAMVVVEPQRIRVRFLPVQRS